MATLKQKKALDLLVGNGGNVTKAMRDAGYSENTANTPQKLTESDGWQELLEEYLPDSLLMKVHKEGLEATRNGGEAGEVPDYAVRHRYLDTGLKVKNKYPVQKVDLTTMGEKIVDVTYVIPTATTEREADSDKA